MCVCAHVACQEQKRIFATKVEDSAKNNPGVSTDVVSNEFRYRILTFLCRNDGLPLIL